MFTEMLKKSVDFLKTGKYSDATDDLEFDVNIPALIPQEYINDIFTRLTYYKKISSQKQIDGLKDIKNELIDRFGLIPENLENLFLVTKLKIELSNFELSFLKLTDSFIRIKFKNENNLNVEKILSIYKNDKNLKILKDGIIQYSKEFDSLENRCHFIKDLAAKIN